MIVKSLIKFVLAGITSIVILSAIMSFYSLTPVHIENSAKNTDYVWPANSFWTKMTEGVAWGRMDANGYNNKEVVSNPDIIVLGSSHMEAFNVMQDENAAYLLGQKFMRGGYSVYNMGISGHNFFKVCQYLPKNLSLYEEVPRVAIIETSTVELSEEAVDEVMKGSVEYTPSYNSGIIAQLQKIPFFRVLYHQLEGGLLDLFLGQGTKGAVEADGKGVGKESEMSVSQSAYEELFGYLRQLQEEYKTSILIVYHPSETLKEDGSITFGDAVYLETFAQAAKEHNIPFVDMTDDFEKMYYESHQVPHGFINTSLGAGHLNAYGHKAVAESLFCAIMELEKEGKLCR